MQKADVTGGSSVSSMFQIPELSPHCSSIRIGAELDVPVTARVRRIIDSQPFRRLASISQLGLVKHVYPGATHSRFEHSLGVYRNAVLFLQQLEADPVFRSLVDDNGAKQFLLASLLHDIGHWPFCHAIEDMQLKGVANHESVAADLLQIPELNALIESDWEMSPSHITAILSKKDASTPSSPSLQVLRSLLSGPIDVDKLDYLDRDSLHSGVPYGRNLDRNRLLKSLCIHPETRLLSITEKGKTAIEMMVFARYVMFSEVYWHHTVRAATAMLQRGVYEMLKSCPSEEERRASVSRWTDQSEEEMSKDLLRASSNREWAILLNGVLGTGRQLFKRVAQWDCTDEPELHQALARRPYEQLVSISRELTGRLKSLLQMDMSPFEILIDAPPVKLEVQFQMSVRMEDQSFRSLGEISPMVQALATKQFDDIVKRVRVFASPPIAKRVSDAGLSVKDILKEFVLS